MHSSSSSPARSSAISKDAVFWPSSRNSLTELTSAIGCSSTSSRTRRRASSKLPRSATTRAPCISAWASLPVAILPSGTMTAPRRPARAAYAAADAAVLPVDAHRTASAPSRTAALTAHVMPRSLNDPVGFRPSSFSHTSAPTRSLKAGARTNGVAPSPSVTMGSPGANGSRSRQRSIRPSDIFGFDDPDGARPRAHEVEGRDHLQRGIELRFEDRMDDHRQPRVSPQPLLHDRLDADPLDAQHLRDLGQHAGPVGDLHVQVEGRLDVLDELQALARRRRLGGRDHRADDVA